jgi:hypothetical protein
MDIQTAIKAKGGMCENPFGGHFRLSKLDIQDWAGGSDQPEELLYRGVILEAVSSYLFFGLGHNGMVANEFLMASDYFFNVDSDKPETWNQDREVRVSDIALRAGHGSRKNQIFIQLTDDQMAEMCFDRQYERSGLDRAMNIDWFRRLLKVKRRNIIEANFEQVSAYLKTLRQQAANRGEYLRSGTYHGDLLETLVAPTDEALASLLYPLRQIAQVRHRSPFRLPHRVNGHRDWNGYKADRAGLPVSRLEV